MIHSPAGYVSRLTSRTGQPGGSVKTMSAREPARTRETLDGSRHAICPAHLDPNRLEPPSSRPSLCPERLAEVAEILAVGLVRLRARQSSRLSAHPGERFVDFMPAESGVRTRRVRGGKNT